MFMLAVNKFCTATIEVFNTCFRDMDLPKEELEDVIHKVKQVLKKVDYQSVPPLVYHLVQVVHSKLPHRVLQVVINYFNKQDLKMQSSQNQDCASDINTEDLMSEDAIGKAVVHIFHCHDHSCTLHFLTHYFTIQNIAL